MSQGYSAITAASGHTYGNPYHGLVTQGVLTLPNTDTINLDVMTGPSHEVRVPGQPSVTRNTAQQTSDTANGREWRNYGLIANNHINGVPFDFANSWLYIDGAGEIWQMRVVIEVQFSTTVIARVYAQRRFGHIGPAAVAMGSGLQVGSNTIDPSGNYPYFQITTSRTGDRMRVTTYDSVAQGGVLVPQVYCDVQLTGNGQLTAPFGTGIVPTITLGAGIDNRNTPTPDSGVQTVHNTTLATIVKADGSVADVTFTRTETRTNFFTGNEGDPASLIGQYTLSTGYDTYTRNFSYTATWTDTDPGPDIVLEKTGETWSGYILDAQISPSDKHPDHVVVSEADYAANDGTSQDSVIHFWRGHRQNQGVTTDLTGYVAENPVSGAFAFDATNQIAYI